MELAIALLVALVIALAWLAWRITRLGHDVSRLAHDPSESLELLQREVEAVRSGVDARLSEHGNYAQDLIQRLTSLQKAHRRCWATWDRTGRAAKNLPAVTHPRRIWRTHA